MIEQNWQHPEHATSEQKIALGLAMQACADDKRHGSDKVIDALAFFGDILKDLATDTRAKGEAPYPPTIEQMSAAELARMMSAVEEIGHFTEVTKRLLHKRFTALTGTVVFVMSPHDPAAKQLEVLSKLEKSPIIAKIVEGQGTDIDHAKLFDKSVADLKQKTGLTEIDKLLDQILAQFDDDINAAEDTTDA